MSQIHILIVGAGASGLMAAIQAARAGARVTLVEQKEKPGKKLLATGNGHCNFTNRKQEKACYHDNAFAMQVLSRFSLKDTLAFFEEIGVFYQEHNGYYYPASGQAAAVVSLLLEEISRLGVVLMTDTRVVAIRKKEGKKSSFCAELSRLCRKGGKEVVKKNGKIKRNGGEIRYEKQLLTVDRVILCGGGMASPALGSDGSAYLLAKSLGHTLQVPVPALTGIQCQEDWFPKLAGVRISARVTLLVDGKKTAQDTGELQLTDYGISGIPVFQVSRYAARALEQGKRVEAQLCFYPEFEDEELIRYLSTHSNTQWKGLYPDKLLQVLKSLAFSDREKNPVLAMLEKTRCLTCVCTAVNGFDRAQVTCGGISLKEISSHSMESCLCEGLYLAGEITDVDGICGGYNLQWAWSSGALAGQCAAGEKDATTKNPETGG